MIWKLAALLLLLVPACASSAPERTREAVAPVEPTAAPHSSGKPDVADGAEITCDQLLDKVAELGGLRYTRAELGQGGEAIVVEDREFTAEELPIARRDFLSKCNTRPELVPPEVRLCVMRAQQRDDLKPCKKVRRWPPE